MKDFSFQTFSKLYFYRERKKESILYFWLQDATQPQVPTLRVQGGALGTHSGKRELPSNPRLDGDRRPGNPLLLPNCPLHLWALLWHGKGIHKSGGTPHISLMIY